MHKIGFCALVIAVVIAGGGLAAAAPALSLGGADPLDSALSCSNGATATMHRLSTGPGPAGTSPQLGWLSPGGSVFNPVALSGYTIYPADSGGSDAWNGSSFQSYIDDSLANEAHLGTDFIRPTDQFDAADTAWDGTAETNQVWSNMDHLLCQATADGVYAQLDLSFVCKIIDANFGNPNPEPPCFGTYNGVDLYATYWKPVIDKIAAHYAGWDTIAYVSFFGDGGGVPADQPATTALVTAYQQVASEYASQDSSSDPMLVAGGGFTNTNNGYQGGGGAAPWWQQVCNLPSLSACLVKVYSNNDKSYSPRWFSWASSASKPVVDEEFGMMQCHGDGTFSGDAACPAGTKDPGYRILTDRADFYTWNYSQDAYTGAGFAGWAFWNASCATGPGNYDVSDLAGPAVISVIQNSAVNPPAGSHWISGLNGSTCAQASPALSLAETDSLGGAGYTAAGQLVTFTVTAANTGNVTLQDVTVSDGDLAGLSCPPSFTRTLAPGAAVSCTGSYTMSQADLDSGSYTNHAAASSAQAGPVTAADTITAAQGPALTLADADSLGGAGYTPAGQLVTFTVTAADTGNVTLQDVTVSDGDLAGLSCPPSFTGTLAPGAAVSCAGSYTVSQADLDSGSYTNHAAASSAQAGPVTAADTITAAQGPALTLATSTPTIGYLQAGDVISYDYQVTNTGNITLTGISIADLKVLGASCPDARLTPGATETCTGSHAVTAADVTAGKVTDTATAAGTTPASGSVTSTPSSVTVQAAWPVSVTGTYPLAGGAAEGFYLGATANTWTLRVTHPGAGKVTFTGTITINTGKFTAVAGVSLGRGNSARAQGKTLIFAITSRG